MARRLHREQSPETQLDQAGQDLVNGIRNHDVAIIEQFIRQYGGRMLSVANRITRNEADAQDCVQEAFLKALKNIDQFKGHASLGSWLHRIVTNVALMRLRSQVRKREDSLDEITPKFDSLGRRVSSGPLTPGPAVERLLQAGQTQTVVRQAIDQLPESYRAVLIARDIEGFDTNEVAEILDLQPGAVKTRLHRARSALKLLLEPLIKTGAI